MIYLINLADLIALRQDGYPVGILLGDVAGSAWQGPTGLDDVWLQINAPQERFQAIVSLLSDFARKRRRVLRTRVYKGTPRSLRRVRSDLETL